MDVLLRSYCYPWSGPSSVFVPGTSLGPGSIARCCDLSQIGLFERVVSRLNFPDGDKSQNGLLRVRESRKLGYFGPERQKGGKTVLSVRKSWHSWPLVSLVFCFRGQVATGWVARRRGDTTAAAGVKSN